jgi:hypothetical protein
VDHLAVDSFGVHTAASARALADAGIRCALRYFYNSTRDEVRILHDHGIAFCLIAEFDTATWHPPMDSPETGAEHARRAVQAAQNIGIPPGAKITLTIDTMVWPGDLDRTRHYFDLAYPILNDAGYLVDAYGGSFVIDDLVDHGLADTSWEAAARSWSSPTGRVGDYQPSRTAHLRQLVEQPTYGGIQTDLNVYVTNPVGEWMPDGSIGGHHAPVAPTPEDHAMANKAVFCPDHTGGVGWRALDINGRRHREGYTAHEDLELDLLTGIVDGEVELHGDVADRFLAKYSEMPVPGPWLVTAAADTGWAREVAGLAAGESGRFFLVPNRYLVRVHDDAQWNADLFVGTPDKGVVPEPFLYNQPLLPWAVRTADVAAVVAAINAALDDVEVDAALSPEDVQTIAERVVAQLGSALTPSSS